MQDSQNLLENFPTFVYASAEPLVETLRERQATRLSELKKLEAELQGGDVAEGRNIFFSKALCSNCHALEGKGGNFGPDQ